MKYISEDEIQRRLLSTSRKTSADLLRVLLFECTELEQLTVTKLRPMSEAKDGETVLAYNGINFEIWYINKDRNYGSLFQGYIPMPQYKPEE